MVAPVAQPITGVTAVQVLVTFTQVIQTGHLLSAAPLWPGPAPPKGDVISSLADGLPEVFHVVLSDVGPCGNDSTVSSDCSAVGGAVNYVSMRGQDSRHCNACKY